MVVLFYFLHFISEQYNNPICITKIVRSKIEEANSPMLHNTGFFVY